MGAGFESAAAGACQPVQRSSSPATQPPQRGRSPVGAASPPRRAGSAARAALPARRRRGAAATGRSRSGGGHSLLRQNPAGALGSELGLVSGPDWSEPSAGDCGVVRCMLFRGAGGWLWSAVVAALAYAAAGTHCGPRIVYDLSVPGTVPGFRGQFPYLQRAEDSSIALPVQPPGVAGTLRRLMSRARRDRQRPGSIATACHTGAW